MVYPSCKSTRRTLQLFRSQKNIYFTPDTFVWKKGFLNWVPARSVFELQDLFKDDLEPQDLHEEEISKKLRGELVLRDPAILTLRQDPSPYILLLLLLLLIILYMYSF